MINSKSIIQQLKEISTTILFSLSTAVFVLILLLIISSLNDIPIAKFTRDPAQILGFPFYTGVLSYFGILLWCSAAAICIFASILIKVENQKKIKHFLFLAGIITLLLMLDDLFLFHEIVYRKIFFINEKIVLIFYIGIIFIYLLYFRREILKSDYILLIISLIFFFTSILFDRINLPNQSSLHHLFEDGPKFLGITFWFTYYVRICFKTFVNYHHSQIT